MEATDNHYDVMTRRALFAKPFCSLQLRIETMKKSFTAPIGMPITYSRHYRVQLRHATSSRNYRLHDDVSNHNGVQLYELRTIRCVSL